MGINKISPKFLIGYLILFMAVLPCLSQGAIIGSKTTSDQGAQAAMCSYLEDMGISPSKALSMARLVSSQPDTLKIPLSIGAGVQYPDQDVSGEVAIVVVLMAIMMGAAVWAASSSFH